MLSRACRAVVSMVVLCGLINACQADHPDLSENSRMAAELKNPQQSSVYSDGSASDNRDSLIVGLAAKQLQLEPDADMQLVFTVENLTDDAIVILPWGTPMEAVLSADVFDVEHQGDKLPYQGRMIKRSAPTESDYLTVPSGENLDFTVNLSQAYDTRTAGVYTVQLKTRDGLYRFDSQEAPVSTAPLTIERR